MKSIKDLQDDINRKGGPDRADIEYMRERGIVATYMPVKYEWKLTFKENQYGRPKSKRS